MNEVAAPALHSNIVGDPAAPHRVVFLHGLFGRGRNLQRLAQGLLPEAHSMLIDLPNHGASAWTERFDYLAYADAVADHLRDDFAAAGPVDVVGHSMGGKVAMVLALRYPELVRRLTVIDISPVASGSVRGEFAHLLDSLAALDLSEVQHRSDADHSLAAAIPQPGVRGFLLQNLRMGANGFTWEPNLRLLRNSLTEVMGFVDTGDATFTRPVLWIKGARSAYIRDEDAPAMRALFPLTRRVTIRDAGHWVHSEKPEEVVAMLRTFLLAGSAS